MTTIRFTRKASLFDWIAAVLSARFARMTRHRHAVDVMAAVARANSPSGA